MVQSQMSLSAEACCNYSRLNVYFFFLISWQAPKARHPKHAPIFIASQHTTRASFFFFFPPTRRKTNHTVFQSQPHFELLNIRAAFKRHPEFSLMNASRDACVYSACEWNDSRVTVFCTVKPGRQRSPFHPPRRLPLCSSQERKLSPDVTSNKRKAYRERRWDQAHLSCDPETCFFLASPPPLLDCPSRFAVRRVLFWLFNQHGVSSALSPNKEQPPIFQSCAASFFFFWFSC